MNYKVEIINYLESGISLTNEEEGVYDSYVIFTSFVNAKKYYLNVLRNERMNWSIAIKNGLDLKKSQIS